MKQKSKVTAKDRRHLYEYGEQHPIQALNDSSKLEDALLSQIQKRRKQDTPEEMAISSPSLEVAATEEAVDTNALFKKLFSKKQSALDEKIASERISKSTDPVLETSTESKFDAQLFELSQSDAQYKQAILPLIKGENKYQQSASFVLDQYQLSCKFNENSQPDNLIENPIENPFTKLLGSFSDILYCHSNYYLNVKTFRKMYVDHLMNYLDKLHLFLEQSEATENSLPDSGFTKPKVLILAPYRSFAHEIVRILIKRSRTARQLSIKRFEEEFASQDPTANGQSDDMFDVIFDGNMDDSFNIGIALNAGQHKTSLKVYADFYQADVIVASPIALRRSIESKDCADYLSSIQLLIIDGADVIMMQNWEHLEFCLFSLNKIPQQPRDCDFSRLREIYSDGNSWSTRQTVMLSALQAPPITSLFNRQRNLFGSKWLIRKDRITETEYQKLFIPQSFIHFPTKSASSLDDDRFKFFTNTIYPRLCGGKFKEGKLAHVLIFISSYLDYVRVKAFFDRNDVDYESLTEYTSPPNITRVRGWFYNGQARFLLMTERFLFYKRYQIRGIRQIFYYSLPEYSQFYSSLGALIGDYPDGEAGDCKCEAMWTRFDSLRLERIVGTDLVSEHLKKPKDFVLNE